MIKDWYYEVIKSVRKSLPQKYSDGTYIEQRICSDVFSDKDINEKYYYLSDVLPGQLSCRWAATGERYPLSAGECTTIMMIERCREIPPADLEIIRILLMAYFHDLDPILCRSLPGKTMGKLHRLMTNTTNNWLKSDERELTGYWHKNSKKYLPLSDRDLQLIEDKLMDMSLEERIGMFESEDMEPFVRHFCYIIELAFGTKQFYLKSFSLEACEKAMERLESGAI